MENDDKLSLEIENAKRYEAEIRAAEIYNKVKTGALMVVVVVWGSMVIFGMFTGYFD